MGSLRYLNGGEEQQTTEKPETGTTVYYTRESTGERSTTVFTCPKCGRHRLAEKFTRATVLLPVNAVVVNNDTEEDEDEPECDSYAETSEHSDDMTLIDYSKWDNTYECADCHASIDMVTWWFNRSE